jgi:hypothetical protein
VRRFEAGRPSTGTVLGVLALVLALGGTAIGLPGKRNVDRNDLKKNVVKSSNVVNDAITGADVGPGAIGAAEVADGAIGGAKIADGAIGGSEIADGAVASADIAGCPPATQLINGLCWDTAADADLSWANASDTCSVRGGRLPSVGELVAVKNVPGFEFGSQGDAANHYSDTIFVDDTEFRMATVAEDATFVNELQSVDRSFRCVFERLR